jgi:hypothetical protein
MYSCDARDGRAITSGALERPSLGRQAVVAHRRPVLYTHYWSFYLIAVVGVADLAGGGMQMRTATCGGRPSSLRRWGHQFPDPELPVPVGAHRNTVGDAVFVTAFRARVARFRRGLHLRLRPSGRLIAWHRRLFAIDRYRIELDARTRPGVR